MVFTLELSPAAVGTIWVRRLMSFQTLIVWSGGMSCLRFATAEPANAKRMPNLNQIPSVTDHKEQLPGLRDCGVRGAVGVQRFALDSYSGLLPISVTSPANLAEEWLCFHC